MGGLLRGGGGIKGRRQTDVSSLALFAWFHVHWRYSFIFLLSYPLTNNGRILLLLLVLLLPLFNRSHLSDFYYALEPSSRFSLLTYTYTYTHTHTHTYRQ